MVTLGTAYGLCSLVEQGGFVHVCEDDVGCACVTLGKNIAIRYRMVDQKGLNSWSTGHPFTSQVMYNSHNSEYISIFNEKTVKRWKIEDTNLGKLPRIKLKDAAHSILLLLGEPLVVFKSGACSSLSHLANHSSLVVKGFLSEQDTIIAARAFIVDEQRYLVLVVLAGDKNMSCYCVRLIGDALLPDLYSLLTLKLKRKGHSVMSCCFVTRDNTTSLVTLWSDGFVYKLKLPWKQSEKTDLGQFCGLVRAVSPSTAVMTSLSPHHIALYGGDPSEEGAVLAVFNLDFGMVQASTTFKILHKPPRLWAVHDRLLLSFGSRLLCVPYALQTGSVSALVGSRPHSAHAPSSDIMTVVPSVSWEKHSSKPAVAIDQSEETRAIRTEIDHLAAQGLSEAGICDALINQYLQKQDISKLCWCLDNFLDIPEHLTVKLLQFAFAHPEEKFVEAELIPNAPPVLVNGNSAKHVKKKRRKSDKQHVNGDVNGVCSEVLRADDVHQCAASRALFVDKVLKAPRNKSALVPALRTGLRTSDCMNILQYLSKALSSGSGGQQHTTVEWITTVTDAFYQQLLLGKNTECVKSVLKLRDQVDQQIEAINELTDLLPKVLRLKRSKPIARNPLQLKSYSIQRIQLYD